MTDNKQNDHALLSASGSHRWIGCPASVAMEYGLEDETSEYAAEGIAAHELAKFRFSIGQKPKSKYINDEMELYIDSYGNYVESFMTGSHTHDIEAKVDFSNAVINGYGTADAYIFNWGEGSLHVFDLKYGFNKVEAKNNTQMLLYAIGVLNRINEDTFLQKIEAKVKTITLHIAQPRINNFDTWTLSIEELQDWIKYFQVASIRALTLTDEFNPSSTNCKYCKAKKVCPALNKFVEDRSAELKLKMQSGEVLNNGLVVKEYADNNFIKKVLDNSSLIKDYLVLIERIAKERLIAGESIPGYKAVQTMSCRKLNKDAEEELYNSYGEKIYQKKLLGLGELERVVGKKNLDSLTHKEVGSIAVVKDTDKRLSISEALKFDDLTINN